MGIVSTNIETIDFDLPSLQYQNARGQLRISYGYSLADSAKFLDLFQSLPDWGDIANSDREIETLFESNRDASDTVGKLLEMGGVEVSDLENWQQRFTTAIALYSLTDVETTQYEQQIEKQIDGIEFRDRAGVWRVAQPCSSYGQYEMEYRLGQLAKCEASGNTIGELYWENPILRRHCDRILELHNIKTDWLDAQGIILQGLVFHWQGTEALLPRINHVKKSTSIPVGTATPKLQTIDDLRAALWDVTGDLWKAERLMSRYPGSILQQTLEARNRQILESNPELKKKAERSQWRKALQDKMRRDGTQQITVNSDGTIVTPDGRKLRRAV